MSDNNSIKHYASLVQIMLKKIVLVQLIHN